MALSKGELNDRVQDFIRKGQWKKALDVVKQLHALDKGDPQLTLRLADLYLKVGDKDNASKNYIMTGNAFKKQGLNAKAIATYKMVLRTDPSLTGVQDMIDELMGEQANATSFMDKRKLQVDLSKVMPELTEAARMEPEPPPVQEPDDAPVYELDVSIPASGGMIKPIPPPTYEPPAYELPDEGPASFEVETGREEESSSGAYGMVEDAGGFELENGLTEESAASAYDDGPVFELDTGRADSAMSERPEGVIIAPDLREPSDDVEEETEEPLPPEAPEEPVEGLDSLDFGEEFGEIKVAEPYTAPVQAPPVQKPSAPRRKTPLLFDINEEELYEIMGKMKRKCYDTGAYIVTEGEDGDSLNIIRSGNVRVVTTVANKEIELARLGERDFFGEISFLTGRPRTASVVAEEPTEVMVLSREDLNDVIRENPKVEAILRLFHESRVADTVTTLKAVAKDFFR